MNLEERKIIAEIKKYFVKRIGFVYENKDKKLPTLTAIFQGKVYQIEVKTPTGKLSSAQQDFRDKWQEQGGALIVGGLEQVVRVIEYDHPLRDSKKYNSKRKKVCEF
jgi:hypothetical protein